MTITRRRRPHRRTIKGFTTPALVPHRSFARITLFQLSTQLVRLIESFCVMVTEDHSFDTHSVLFGPVVLLRRWAYGLAFFVRVVVGEARSLHNRKKSRQVFRPTQDTILGTRRLRRPPVAALMKMPHSLHTFSLASPAKRVHVCRADDEDGHQHGSKPRRLGETHRISLGEHQRRPGEAEQYERRHKLTDEERRASRAP